MVMLRPKGSDVVLPLTSRITRFPPRAMISARCCDQPETWNDAHSTPLNVQSVVPSCAMFVIRPLLRLYPAGTPVMTTPATLSDPSLSIGAAAIVIGMSPPRTSIDSSSGCAELPGEAVPSSATPSTVTTIVPTEVAVGVTATVPSVSVATAVTLIVKPTSESCGGRTSRPVKVAWSIV